MSQSSQHAIIHPIMRQYEFMLVFRPDFDTKDVKKRDSVIEKLLGQSPVKIKDVTDMGKKRLAYPIKKQEEGIYVLVILTGEAVKVGDIEKQARLQTDVIRYLLIAK